MEMTRNQDTSKSETSSSMDLSLCLATTHEVNCKREMKEGRSFSCKTCKKEFPTFQALGGHRTSHNIKTKKTPELSKRSRKSNTHICPICEAEFEQGQALGGHMRRHRTLLDNLRKQPPLEEEIKEDDLVFKKPSSVENKRIVLSFDLNLTLKENYIKSRLTKTTRSTND